jgi:hypothetical protein
VAYTGELYSKDCLRADTDAGRSADYWEVSLRVYGDNGKIDPATVRAIENTPWAWASDANDPLGSVLVDLACRVGTLTEPDHEASKLRVTHLTANPAA